MIHLFLRHKKLLIIPVILLISLVSTRLKAQEVSYTYSVDSVKTDAVYLYSITISISKGISPFSLYLYDNEPLKNGRIVVKVENTGDSHTFNNLSSLNYYICILDSKKNIKGEWIRRRSE